VKVLTVPDSHNCTRLLYRIEPQEPSVFHFSDFYHEHVSEVSVTAVSQLFSSIHAKFKRQHL